MTLSLKVKSYRPPMVMIRERRELDFKEQKQLNKKGALLQFEMALRKFYLNLNRRRNDPILCSYYLNIPRNSTAVVVTFSNFKFIKHFMSFLCQAEVVVEDNDEDK